MVNFLLGLWVGGMIGFLGCAIFSAGRGGEK